MTKGILFIDTETDGLPQKDLPSGHPNQPHIVQLAAILASSDQQVQAAVNVLIKPTDWTIPPEAARIHGIEQTTCEQFGVPIAGVLAMVQSLADCAAVVVAHNLAFDSQVLRGECVRCKRSYFGDDLEAFCTMTYATPILKLPGKYGRHKWPSLIQTHQHLFKEGFDAAHDAMADTLACMRCYFALTTGVAAARA